MFKVKREVKQYNMCKKKKKKGIFDNVTGREREKEKEDKEEGEEDEGELAPWALPSNFSHSLFIQ